MYRIFKLLFLLSPLFWATGQAPPGRPAGRLLEEARALIDSARYTDAIRRGQEALQLFPAGEPDYAECLLVLGDAFLENGQWEAAAQQYRAALAVFEKTYGPRNLSTAQAYNKLGEYFYKKAAYVQAAEYYQRALAVRETLLGPGHELVADAYNNLGNCRVALADYAAATALHEKALAIRQAALPARHPDLATSWNNLGNCAFLTGQYALAVQRFGRALTIRENAYGPEHPKTALVHSNIGNAYAALGDSRQAITHYRRALGIRQHSLGARHPALAATLENIADLYFDLGDFIAALDDYRQAHAIQRAVQGERSPAAAALWHKIGLCYQYEGDTGRALGHHLAAEPVLVAAFGPGHPYIAGLYNNLGNCYFGVKNYPQAQAYYQRALRIFQQARPAAPANLALVYNNLGTVRLQTGRADDGLAYFEQALSQLRAGDLIRLPDYSLYLKNKGLALEQLGRREAAALAFEQAAEALSPADPLTGVAVLGAWGASLCRRGIAQSDPALLQQAVGVLDSTLRQAEHLRAQMSAPAARQRWIDLQYPVVADALEACFHLWKQAPAPALIERAFALAERNKSLQLLDDMRREQAERFAGIPDSLLERERSTGEQLNQLEKQYLARLAARDTAGARTLEPGLMQARQALNALAALFERQYPAYHRIRYEQPPVSTVDVQKRLLAPGNRALLEYAVTDSAVFVFVLTSRQLHWTRMPRDTSLDQRVRALRQRIQAYPGASGDAVNALNRSVASAAYALYSAIVAPAEALASLPERLLIVPDGVLAYLPFECLLSAPPADPDRFRSHAYLLRRYAISYAHSAAQLLALQERPAPASGQSLLAVAPAYEHNPYGLRPLKFNRTEARAVSALFGGDLQEGPAATSRLFLDAAGRYSMLLLATHGQASSAPGDLSYLAFSADSAASSFLYARDLYRLPLNAGLVVLSACETGLGEYRRGQGVSSLAKGFFHAGARSVVATLWSVDDAKNAELIRRFFIYIRDGLDKDDALRRAQIDFLDAHPHDEAHPVYWAALTAYGEMDPIEAGWGKWWWWVLLFVATAGAVIWIRRARLR